MHMFIWKEAIGEIARVDLKGQRYITANVLRRAKQRCIRRMHAFEQEVAIFAQRKISQGEDPSAGFESYQNRVKGIMSLDEDGTVSIDAKMRAWLDSIEDSKEEAARGASAPVQGVSGAAAHAPPTQKEQWPPLETCFVRQKSHD